MSESGETLAVENVRTTKHNVQQPSSRGSVLPVFYPESIPNDLTLPTQALPPTPAQPTVSITTFTKASAIKPAVTISSIPQQPAQSQNQNQNQNQKQADEIAAQLATEKAQGLAIMRGLLSRGWAVDLDELEHPGEDDDDDAPGASKTVLRRASPIVEDVEDVSLNSDNESGEESQSNSDNDNHENVPANEASQANDAGQSVDGDAGADAIQIAHAVFDDASSSDESSDEDEDDAEDGGQAKSTTVAESSSSPNSPKAPLPADHQSSSAQTPPVPTTQGNSLKDLFAPREEEGTSHSLPSDHHRFRATS